MITVLLRRTLPLCAIALLGACSVHRFDAPTVDPSTAPRPGGTLTAGFGRADITPPPGPGLMGYGPEGKPSRGWRTRLHARALVLEDERGERLALVTLDLGLLSPLLHREVAARVADVTGLGPDRIILAATHTHAGPGHHFGYPSYDEFGTSVSGFDPAMVAFLADRIARAVIDADTTRAEARAAWGTRALWDLTANRSTEPFARNPAEWRARFRKPLGSTASGNVDSTLAVLRIDIRDGATGAFRPAGAFSIFAIHGTGNPSANELFDADIQGIAARALELHIDRLNGELPAFRPRAVHLLANGAEGDVVPDIPRNTRCQVPTLHRVRRPSGPRTPPGPELWIPPHPDSQAACVQHARAELDFVGDSIGAAIVALFDSLGAHLTGELPIRRVFHVANLTDRDQTPQLCTPQPGAPTLGGAEGGYTRYRDWHILGMIDVGFDEESPAAARSRPGGCQAHKRVFPGRLQRRMIARLLPDVAQLTIAGIGDMLLVTLPFEATTVVGGRVRAAALAGAGSTGSRFRDALLIGLANGYNQYVATGEEYALQNYEGASTLYGPRTAEYLATMVEGLAAQLPGPGQSSPAADIAPIQFRHLGTKSILPRADRGSSAGNLDRQLSAAWRGDTLVVRWIDMHPGRLVPADGPVLEIRSTDEDGAEAVLWDDDRDLEVWALGPARGGGYQWEARWRPLVRPPGAVDVRRAGDESRVRDAVSVPPG
jgi:neutral ceramidase